MIEDTWGLALEIYPSSVYSINNKLELKAENNCHWMLSLKNKKKTTDDLLIYKALYNAIFNDLTINNKISAF